MDQKVYEITQPDQHVIHIHQYVAETIPKGAILILHGMAEHYERYDKVAMKFAQNGYHTYIYSHRGHGTDLTIQELGFFNDTKGYQLVVQDAINVLKFIHSNSVNLPLFLFGHSMGSIIARNVIQQYDSLDGVIICGTANPNRFMTLGGLALSVITGCYLYPKKRAPLMDKLMFQTSLYKKVNRRTNYDWLCTDESVVDQYMKDAYCGFICTKSFYHDLLTLTLHASNKKNIRKTDLNLPIMIISGGNDPVGGFGKDVLSLVQSYKRFGYHITSKIYDGLRHEILNEPNHNEIIDDILLFMNNHS